MAGSYVLQQRLNELAGTTAQMLSAQGAANAWAGTTGLAMLGALNAKARSRGVIGATDTLDLDGVCNKLGGTTGKAAVAALEAAV
jgi:hypothetical protein